MNISNVLNNNAKNIHGARFDIELVKKIQESKQKKGKYN